MPLVNCDPYNADGDPYVPWIAKDFGDCVYSTQDQVSFFIGMSSICFWLFAQAPQLYTNYKNGKAEALSPAFLSAWLCGDITNLTGAILTHQLPTQIWTAIYFCFMDVILLSQYIYYAFKNRSKPTLEVDDSDLDSNSSSESLVNSSENNLKIDSSQPHSDSESNFSVVARQSVVLAATSLPFVARILLESAASKEAKETAAIEETLGTIIGWISGVLYVSSRTPQIYKNYKRKSVEGLALMLFVCAVMGNLTYGLAIFLRSTKWSFLETKLPWLVGSLGTLCFDFTIFIQFLIFGANKSSEDDSEITKLVSSDTIVDSTSDGYHSDGF